MDCDHNVIPIRAWWRRRWLCVRCNRMFPAIPPREGPKPDRTLPMPGGHLVVWDRPLTEAEQEALRANVDGLA